MANLFSKLQVSNKPHKGSFDLSYRNIVSCEFGQLIPFDIRECVPSDHFRINTSTFTRTKPLVSAAYTRFREHLDYYFVPYRLLWRFSDSLFTDTPINNTALSSLQGASSPTGHAPVVTGSSLEHVIRFLQDPRPTGVGSKKAHLLDDGGIYSDVSTKQLLTLLGYGNWYDALGWDFHLPQQSMFRALAYQKIYQDFYRNDQWEPINPSAYNVDYLVPTITPAYPVPNVFSDENIDNVMANNPFAMRYANFPRDIFTGMLPRQQYGATAYAQIDVNYDGLISSGSIYLNGQAGTSPNVVAHNGSLELSESSGQNIDINFTHNSSSESPIKAAPISTGIVAQRSEESL